MALAKEMDTPRAGDSAFAGPRSPAPLAGGGASGSGRAALNSFYGTSVSTRHHTPGLCWCQPYLFPYSIARRHLIREPKKAG